MRGNPTLPIYQQDIERQLGWPLGSACSPTCFYAEAGRLDYPSGRLDSAQFVGMLALHENYRPSQHWMRPSLSTALRVLHGLGVVSWNTTNQPQDIGQMVESGYLHSKREIDFFTQEVAGKSVLEVVKNHHVIATMAPGFATNKDLHAVVLSQAVESDTDRLGDIQAFNPDNRTSDTEYTSEYISKTLLPNGACSVVLPPL